LGLKGNFHPASCNIDFKIMLQEGEKIESCFSVDKTHVVNRCKKFFQICGN